MIITIQPKLREDGVLPYPFHLDAEGAVLRQDFWQGRVAHLVGFQSDPEVNAVDLRRQDFLADPQLAVGMHPVMADSKGGLATYVGAIEKVTVQTEED